MINERLQQLLSEIGMSQRQFALELNTDPSHVSRILNGKVNPSSRLIHMIASTFEVNQEWLEHGTGDMFISDVSENKRRLLASIDKLNEEQIKAVSSFIKYLKENE